MTELVTIACFALLVSPAVMHYMIGRRQRLDREHELERRLGNCDARRLQSSALAPANPAIERLVAAVGGLPWIGGYLAETIRPASAPTLLAIPLLFAGATIAAASRLGAGGAMLAGIVPAALPLLYLRRIRKRQLNLLNEQLPYLIDLLKSALEAGHTILRALQMAGQNLPEPVSSELRLIVEQVQLGMTLPLALEAMYEREGDRRTGLPGRRGAGAERRRQQPGRSSSTCLAGDAQSPARRASVACAHCAVAGERDHRNFAPVHRAGCSRRRSRSTRSHFW